MSAYVGGLESGRAGGVLLDVNGSPWSKLGRVSRAAGGVVWPVGEGGVA